MPAYDDPRPAPNLADLPKTLFRVEPKLSRYPVLAVPRFQKVLDYLGIKKTSKRWVGQFLRMRRVGNTKLQEVCRFLTQQNVKDMAKAFDMAELAAFRHSHIYDPRSEYEHALEENLIPLMMHKLMLSSAHRGSRAGWNHLVTAYEAILDFKLPHPDFTYHFDATSGSNYQGYSRYTRTFLDGEIAILIYYKGEHAITVSFDLVGVRRRRNSLPKIHLHQIQLKQHKGNRFLFHLKPGYIEAITAEFVRAFSAFDVLLIHGDHATSTIMGKLQRELTDLEMRSELSDDDKAVMAFLQKEVTDIPVNVAPRLRRLYSSRFRSLCRRVRRCKGYSLVALQSSLSSA